MFCILNRKKLTCIHAGFVRPRNASLVDTNVVVGGGGVVVIRFSKY